MSRQTLTAANGQLTVQIPGMSASSAYQVLLRPAGGGGAQQLYYAANASVSFGVPCEHPSGRIEVENRLWRIFLGR